MRKINRTLGIIVFAVVLISNSAIAQNSDHDIKTGFSEKYDSLEYAVTSAKSVADIDSLILEVNALDKGYSDHVEILDNALYPSSYSAEMTALYRSINTAEQKLLIIENQSERLSKLGNELAQYKSELDIMNKKTDSLRTAIARSHDSEERLSKLVTSYRESLERRDELVMNVIDSMLVSYNGMNSAKLQELADGVESGRINPDNNPLNLISAVIEENTEYSKSNGRALSVDDHLRMYAVQRHFEEAWDQIGDRMIYVYGGNTKKQWENSIDSKMKEWRMSTSKNMWKSMDNYLEFSNVELSAFDNNYSFFVALDKFVKDAKEESKSQVLSSESYDDYKKFQEFWSGKIKNEWSNLVQDAEVLTVAQISTIDQQLSGWEAEARPIHPLILILLVLTGVALLGFMFVMFKTRSAR